MSALIVQPTLPGWRFWLLWILATVLGTAAGLLLSIPANLVFLAAQRGALSDPWYLTQLALIHTADGTVLTKALLGLGVGLGQWLLLRKHLKHVGGWIFATGLASFVEGAIRWSLLSDIPIELIGPITTLCISILVGVCQWLVLRGRVPHAEWWIVFISAGAVFTIVIGVAVEYAQISLDSFLELLIILVAVLVPFGIAAAGMVWLLRQTSSAHQAIAP